MKLAVASDMPDFGGKVPALFSETPYFLVVDMESGDILDILSRASCGGTDEESDLALAREILRWDCEGVLCGPLERPPFLVIADEGQITRYNAAGMGVYDALSLANSRQLELLRDHIGGGGCQGEHKEGQGESKCDCDSHKYE